jgi:hypothetical protein
MVNDLVKNHLRQGMSCADVLALLGEPDDKADNLVGYYLGGRSGGFILPGYDFLELEFNSGWELQAYRI